MPWRWAACSTVGPVSFSSTGSHGPPGGPPAILATLGLAFGTFLYWYLAFAPTMGHATGFASAALFVWLWLRPEPRGTRRGLFLGAALGLAALNRWSSTLLLLLPAVETLPRLPRRSEWAWLDPAQ